MHGHEKNSQKYFSSEKPRTRQRILMKAVLGFRVLDETGNMARQSNTGPRALCWRKSEIKSGTDKGDPDNDPE